MDRSTLSELLAGFLDGAFALNFLAAVLLLPVAFRYETMLSKCNALLAVAVTVLFIVCGGFLSFVLAGITSGGSGKTVAFVLWLLFFVVVSCAGDELGIVKSLWAGLGVVVAGALYRGSEIFRFLAGEWSGKNFSALPVATMVLLVVALLLVTLEMEECVAAFCSF